jgi:hypothetical protein
VPPPSHSYWGNGIHWPSKASRSIPRKEMVLRAFDFKPLSECTFDSDFYGNLPINNLLPPRYHSNGYFNAYWPVPAPHANALIDLWPYLLSSVKGGGAETLDLYFYALFFLQKIYVSSTIVSQLFDWNLEGTWSLFWIT